MTFNKKQLAFGLVTLGTVIWHTVLTPSGPAGHRDNSHRAAHRRSTEHGIATEPLNGCLRDVQA